jgi:hypothetical protein
VEIDADMEKLKACLKVEGPAEVVHIEKLQRQQERISPPLSSNHLQIVLELHHV